MFKEMECSKSAGEPIYASVTELNSSQQRPSECAELCNVRPVPGGKASIDVYLGSIGRTVPNPYAAPSVLQGSDRNAHVPEVQIMETKIDDSSDDQTCPQLTVPNQYLTYTPSSGGTGDQTYVDVLTYEQVDHVTRGYRVALTQTNTAAACGSHVTLSHSASDEYVDVRNKEMDVTTSIVDASVAGGNGITMTLTPALPAHPLPSDDDYVEVKHTAGHI